MLLLYLAKFLYVSTLRGLAMAAPSYGGPSPIYCTTFIVTQLCINQYRLFCQNYSTNRISLQYAFVC